MKLTGRFSISALTAGMCLLFLGLNIFISGYVKFVVLGDKKYFVGGVIAVIGTYLIILGLRGIKKIDKVK